jgi:hypothetical protein
VKGTKYTYDVFFLRGSESWTHDWAVGIPSVRRDEARIP